MIHGFWLQRRHDYLNRQVLVHPKLASCRWNPIEQVPAISTVFILFLWGEMFGGCDVNYLSSLPILGILWISTPDWGIGSFQAPGDGGNWIPGLGFHLLKPSENGPTHPRDQLKKISYGGPLIKDTVVEILDCSGFGMLILLMFFELITIDLSEFSETVCFQVVCLRVEEDWFTVIRTHSEHAIQTPGRRWSGRLLSWTVSCDLEKEVLAILVVGL